MIPNIKTIQDKNDWLFVLDQAKRGDKKAENIYRQFQCIISELNRAIKEKENCLPAYRFVYRNEIKSLLDEKDDLLLRYKIRRKRAKNYLKCLRRKE